MIEERFSFKNHYNDEIKGNILYNEGLKNLPLVIILHGFKGWKDWGFIPYLSKSIAQSNAIVIRFDFSLNGMIEGSDLVAHPGKFASNTVSREISDVTEVFSKFKDGTLVEGKSYEDIWNGKVFMVGHSLGGAISILASEVIKPDGLVLLASISRFARYTDRQKEQWRKDGCLRFTNNRTGQELSINLSYLEDIEQNNYNEKLMSALKNFNHPVLILHGSEDMTVPVSEANEIAGALKNNHGLRMKIIERTGHTFGVEHPFTKTNQALEDLITETKQFIGLQ
jgi:pimeloyl-ACP methyl ester carboxylesterase